MAPAIARSAIRSAATSRSTARRSTSWSARSSACSTASPPSGRRARREAAAGAARAARSPGPPLALAAFQNAALRRAASPLRTRRSTCSRTRSPRRSPTLVAERSGGQRDDPAQGSASRDVCTAYAARRARRRGEHVLGGGRRACRRQHRRRRLSRRAGSTRSRASIARGPSRCSAPAARRRRCSWRSSDGRVHGRAGACARLRLAGGDARRALRRPRTPSSAWPMRFAARRSW